MIDEYILNKVLDSIKEIIRIEKFDDTKMLIETDDELPDDLTVINVILIKCVIKDFDNVYLQILLEPAFVWQI